MDEVIWLDPLKIQYKIAPKLDGIRAGDWDIERRHIFAETVKAQSIKAHFVDGADWRETELFKRVYTRRLKEEGRVGQWRSLDDLAREYVRRYDGLFVRLKRDGFKVDDGNGRNYALPSLLIGRGGEIFIGNQGNHRLAMAQILRLDKIAGKITCRHQSWTP